jgi:hypothetical protein
MEPNTENSPNPASDLQIDTPSKHHLIEAAKWSNFFKYPWLYFPGPMLLVTLIALIGLSNIGNQSTISCSFGFLGKCGIFISLVIYILYFSRVIICSNFRVNHYLLLQ